MPPGPPCAVTIGARPDARSPVMRYHVFQSPKSTVPVDVASRRGLFIAYSRGRTRSAWLEVDQRRITERPRSPTIRVGTARINTGLSEFSVSRDKAGSLSLLAAKLEASLRRDSASRSPKFSRGENHRGARNHSRVPSRGPLKLSALFASRLLKKEERQQRDAEARRTTQRRGGNTPVSLGHRRPYLTFSASLGSPLRLRVELFFLFSATCQKLSALGYVARLLLDFGEPTQRKGVHRRRTLLHQHAAIHDKTRPGDVARVIRRQKHRRSGDVLRRPQSVHRNHLAPFDRILGGEIVREDEPGTMAFTRMPYGARSSAIARVIASMPPFDASYATLPRCALVAPPLDMWMMLPEPLRAMMCAARSEQRNAPLRLTPSILSHHSSSPSRKWRAAWMLPALFTRMSTVPKCSMVKSNIASTCDLLETSAGKASASPPGMAWATCVARAASRSLTTTRAPSAANRSATAWPMPWPAPVTMTTLFRKRSGSVIRCLWCRRRNTMGAMSVSQ